jgi:hypothetical protein
LFSLAKNWRILGCDPFGVHDSEFHEQAAHFDLFDPCVRKRNSDEGAGFELRGLHYLQKLIIGLSGIPLAIVQHAKPPSKMRLWNESTPGGQRSFGGNLINQASGPWLGDATRETLQWQNVATLENSISSPDSRDAKSN